MLISDKQELRRCLKQLVRRADVCEASLDFDLQSGETGVEAMLDLWARPAITPAEALERTTAEQTPFSPDAAAMFAALDAMDLPVKDLDKAKALADAYEREAYIHELMDTLRARMVLIRVEMDKAAQTVYHDGRFEPLLVVGDSLFVPGRYGVDYAGAAESIAAAARSCSAHNLVIDRFDFDALRYCLMPVCEDERIALHIHLNTLEEIERFTLLLDAFDGVRALVSAPAHIESALIDAAAQRVRMLVCLSDLAHLRMAMGRLGTRLVPYSAHAREPGQLLGLWINQKETIWQALAEVYLALARTGYPLESAALERDVRRMLSGNLLSLCRPEQE